MMRLRSVCSVLAVILAGVPVIAIAAEPARAEAPRPLADRIQDAIDRYQSAGTRPSLDELTALTAEADKDTALDAGLRADLATIYAYTLARNKQGDKAIEVIVAAQKTYGVEDRKMGDLLLAEAVFEDFTGHGDAALATKQKALGIYIAALGPDDVLVATTRVQIAFSLFARGQLEDALDLYGKGLPIMAGDDSVVRVYATQMANYANALRLSGDLDGSLATGRTALEVARAKLPAGHTALLYSLDNTGATLMEMGRYSEAETLLREAVDAAHKALGSASVDTAGFTYHLAQVLALEGHDAEAQSLLHAALADLDGVNTGPNPDLPGLIHLELARLARDGGDLEASRTELEAGLMAVAPAGHTGDMTRSRLETRLAEIFLIEEDLVAARAQVSAALLYYRDNLPAYAPDRVNAEMLGALISSRQGDTAAAYDDAAAVAATLTARLDGDGATRNEQAEASRAYTQAFALYVDIALSAGHADTAFAAAQRAALTEVSATSQGLAARAASDDPKARDLARSLQDTQVRRGRLDRQRTYALARSTAEVARLDGQIADADGALKALSAQLDTAFPAFASLSHPHPISIDDARATLDIRRAIVMPVTSADRLLTLVVTRKGLTWDSAPLTRGRVDNDVRHLRASISAGLLDPSAPFDRATAWELGEAMFTPKVLAALDGRDTVEVLGAGPLMTVPFSLLLTQAPQGADNDPRALRDSAWLIRRFAVSVRPALITARHNATVSNGFLGVGAPILGPEADGSAGDVSQYEPLFRGDKDTVADVDALRHLPSLPRAKEELVRMLGALSLPHSDLVTGADATETRLKTMQLDSYSVIAFATHGLVSGNLQAVREPALVLTPPQQPSDSDDGLLTASDVAGLRLNARWVILSACNTGAGREAGAAGYSGLARAFMQAGAQSLMVSLWPVRDDVADRLAVDTVERSARGDTQPQALRKAVLGLLKDGQVKGSANPAIWAPFSLVVQ